MWNKQLFFYNLSWVYIFGIHFRVVVGVRVGVGVGADVLDGAGVIGGVQG